MSSFIAEITSSDVYWVMQADSFKALFIGASVVIGLSAAWCWAIVFSRMEFNDAQGGMPRVATLTTMALILVAIACAFTPSTRSLAAIHVVPALANSQAVKTEVPELYELAKEALRGAIETGGQK